MVVPIGVASFRSADEASMAGCMTSSAFQDPSLAPRFARAKFRSWHRGTREADYMIGGYFDRYHAEWSEAELVWFEAILDEDDVDIMAWALKTQPTPDALAGDSMTRMQLLDYVTIGAHHRA